MPKKTDRIQSGSENATPSTDLRLGKLIHNIDDDVFELEIEFASITGGRQYIRVPRSTLQSPAEILRRLLDSGARLPIDRTEAKRLLQKVLNTEPAEHLEVTKRGGWHGDSFVRRNWTAGSKQALRLAGKADDNNPMDSQAGTLASWKEGLAKACERSSYLSFGIGVSFAAPLLGLIGENEGAMFNFHGPSSSGKSLTCRASQSVFARAAKNEMPTYDITDRALEELCFERCDLTVVFDEEGRAKGGVEVRESRSRTIAFTVAGGHGMARSKIVSQNQGLSNLKWRVLALTSSEVPLETGYGRMRADGERVRHIDIAIPNDERGIFDRLKPDASQSAVGYARSVEDTIRDHHGVALKPYVSALIRGGQAVRERVSAVMEAFLVEMEVGTDPWECRFARKFALVEAGMILSAEYDAAPWTADHAQRSVRRMYRVARKSVYSTQDVARELLASLNRALEDRNRFPSLAKGQELPAHLKDVAWGFRREHPVHGPIVAVDPQQLEKVHGAKAAQRAITDHLSDIGAIVKGKDGKSHLQLAVSGFNRTGRSRWLCFRKNALRTGGKTSKGK
jgi:hypothetical protein